MKILDFTGFLNEAYGVTEGETFGDVQISNAGGASGTTSIAYNGLILTGGGKAWTLAFNPEGVVLKERVSGEEIAPGPKAYSILYVWLGKVGKLGDTTYIANLVKGLKAFWSSNDPSTAQGFKDWIKALNDNYTDPVVGVNNSDADSLKSWADGLKPTLASVFGGAKPANTTPVAGTPATPVQVRK